VAAGIALGWGALTWRPMRRNIARSAPLSPYVRVVRLNLPRTFLRPQMLVLIVGLAALFVALDLVFAAGEALQSGALGFGAGYLGYAAVAAHSIGRIERATGREFYLRSGFEEGEAEAEVLWRAAA
jgi:hypothetical protein